MALTGCDTRPTRNSYDVVIVRGAIMGSPTAWWMKTLGFSGSILVVEQDPSCESCSTAHTDRMPGIDIPVEPRKRYIYIFKAETPLDQALPLTIDPSGIHVHENGSATYLAGRHPAFDPPVDFDDFAIDHNFWPDYVWPRIGNRIPAFEAVKVQAEWLIYRAYQILDMRKFSYERIVMQTPIVETAVI